MPDVSFAGTSNVAADAKSVSFRIGSKQSVTVAAGGDDAEQVQPGTTVDSTNIQFLIANARCSAARFLGLQIPQGSTITKATVSFVCGNSKHNDANMRIWANNVDNAAAIPTSANGITSLARTTASTTWVQNDLFTNTTSYFSSVDISAPVQEVINRGGWALSNAMTLIISGNNGTNWLSAKSYNADPASAPKLDVVWIPPAQSIALSGSGNIVTAAATATAGTMAITRGFSGSTSAAATVRASSTYTVSWDGNDFDQGGWLVDPVNEDEAPTGTVVASTHNHNEVDGGVEFWLDPWDDQSGTRSYSNRRDFVVFTGGPTFKDGTIRVKYDPPRFASGSPPTTYRPQHGVLARWVDNTDHHLGIVVWHDITVPFSGVQNFGVWRTERPMTGLTTISDPPVTVRRSAANTPGFGLSSGGFPYWVETEFSGEKLRIRVWHDGNSPPDWDSATQAAERNLSQAVVPGSGSNAYSRTPTPAEGKVGVMIGHISSFTTSVARVEEFTVTQYDAITVTREFSGSGNAAATASAGTMAVERPMAGSADAAATIVTDTLGFNRALSGASSVAADAVSELFGVERVFVGSVDAAATVVDSGFRLRVDINDPTLTALGSRLTMTSIGQPLTLTAIEEEDAVS